MLEIKNLTKTYQVGDVLIQALDHIDLHIEKGSFVSVMGPSGSGKSTLLHMIAGVDAPDCGEVVIAGTNISRLKSSEQAVFRRRQIGIVYQSYNLIPTLTVEENITLPILLDRKKPDRREVEALLELLSLTIQRRQLPNQLSGGQQQRTAIGRALITKPSLLLADEPTGNLDSRNAEEVIRFLCTANQEQGQTIILVTHDAGIGSMAGRQLWMKDGSIVSDQGSSGGL